MKKIVFIRNFVDFRNNTVLDFEISNRLFSNVTTGLYL